MVRLSSYNSRDDMPPPFHAPAFTPGEARFASEGKSATYLLPTREALSAAVTIIEGGMGTFKVRVFDCDPPAPRPRALLSLYLKN